MRKSKVVKGTKKQKRPSASYYYRKLNKPIGYKISYRPRKGGKYILHSLQLRKNGTPYWKPLEKLTKRTIQNKKTNRKQLRTNKIKKTRGKHKKRKKRKYSSLKGG